MYETLQGLVHELGGWRRLRQLMEVGGETLTEIYCFSLKCQIENLSLGLRAGQMNIQDYYLGEGGGRL